jgi:hypothetical protein
MFDDATWVDPLSLASQPFTTVPYRQCLNPFCATPVDNARQHPRPGLFRGPVFDPPRLDRGEGCSSLGPTISAEMVLQWRGERVGAEHALQGGHGHGELLPRVTKAQEPPSLT